MIKAINRLLTYAVDNIHNIILDFYKCFRLQLVFTILRDYTLLKVIV